MSQHSEQDSEAATVAYYDAHADEFYANTVDADMAQFYAPFLALVPPAGRILDAGCGSGRDSRYFKQRGYRVTAMDASKELVRRGSALLGQPVLHLRFQDVAFRDAFEGIWACASLLHVSRSHMDDVLTRLTHALVRGGALFVSFKYGDGEGHRNGRWFNSYNETTFADLIARQPLLHIERCWKTVDVRAGRAMEYWLDAVVTKKVGDIRG